MKNHYFLHGDRNFKTGLYFCRRCEAFNREEHFSDETHIGERNRRVNESLDSLRKYSANRPESMFRLSETVNLFATELPASITRRLTFTESFLTWLSHSTENASILEAASSHPANTIPTYDDIFETIEAQDQDELSALYQRYITL